MTGTLAVCDNTRNIRPAPYGSWWYIVARALQLFTLRVRIKRIVCHLDGFLRLSHHKVSWPIKNGTNLD
ncbi:hypothetical protein J6590_105969 [Homalodisca vitripennis]|nr:hypothetical protein J6590_105969 [Homalodisca vitripennis]